MRVVLDTGVFFLPAALHRLTAVTETVIVPAIVFTERARHLRRDGRSIEEFRAALEDNGWEVESYGAEEGLRYAIDVKDAQWLKHAQDAMIAGHVRPGDELWTTNPRDFLKLGLPPLSVIDVLQTR